MNLAGRCLFEILISSKLYYWFHSPVSHSSHDKAYFLGDFFYNNRQQKIENLWTVNFAHSAGHRVKLKEGKKRDKYLDQDRKLKKAMEYKRDSDINCIRCTWYSQQRIGAGTRGLGN